tara:strand:+ start:705 stop:1832 length:1128 start_codon:yes stop_codon:yes gene_type:complete
MAKYATGKKSQAISDVGGLRVPYPQLKTTWDGLRVSPEDFDPKQPQLTPAKNVVDATALRNPRPDTDPENVVVYIGYTQDWTVDSRLRTNRVGVEGLGTVGFVANVDRDYIFDVTGVSGTGAIGTAIVSDSEDVVVTGLAGTGAIGTETFALDALPPSAVGTGAIGITSEITNEPHATGVAGTGDIGTPTFAITTDAPVTSVIGTGAIGSELIETDVPDLSVAGTGAIGTETFETFLTPNASVGTGAIGAEVPEVELAETGVAGTGEVAGFGISGDGNIQLLVTGISGIGATGAIGEEISASEAIETGVAGTGAIGTASILTELGWGIGEWGQGAWQADTIPRPASVVGTGAIGSVSVEFTTSWGQNGYGEGQWQ